MILQLLLFIEHCASYNLIKLVSVPVKLDLEKIDRTLGILAETVTSLIHDCALNRFTRRN